MSDAIEWLMRLHTDAVDAHNGYAEAVHGSRGGAPLDPFERMQAFYAGAARELGAEVERLGGQSDYGGSFMSVVHQSIVKLRGTVGKLDGDALSGLIEREQGALGLYDDALASGALDARARTMAASQRKALGEAVAALEARQVD